MDTETEVTPVQTISQNPDGALDLWIPFGFRQQLYPIEEDRKTPAKGEFFFVGYTVRCINEQQSVLLLILARYENEVYTGELICDCSYVFLDTLTRDHQLLLNSLEKTNDSSVN